MPDKHSIELRVRYAETDQGGRVYHSNYFVWFDMARTDYLASAGINYENLEKNEIYVVVKKIECEYVAPAYFNQLLTIEINKVKFNRVKLEFNYRVLHGEVELARAYTKLAFIDSKGRLIKIPDNFKDKLMERESQ